MADSSDPTPDREFYSSHVTVPLRCNPLCRAPSREIRETIERHNAGVLGFLLQGIDLEAMPRPADERLAEALAPIRMKLDMLIDMLARLSYRDADLPPLCEAELRPNQVAWHSEQPWSPGKWLRIELYFNPAILEPVSLLAEVTRCFEQTQGNGWRLEADLIEMPRSLGEKLARLALLNQRHQWTRKSTRTAVRKET